MTEAEFYNRIDEIYDDTLDEVADAADLDPSMFSHTTGGMIMVHMRRPDGEKVQDRLWGFRLAADAALRQAGIRPDTDLWDLVDVRTFDCVQRGAYYLADGDLDRAATCAEFVVSKLTLVSRLREEVAR